MNFYDALKKSGAILEARFAQSKDILHSASKGTIREIIIKEVLRPFLPECYGLSGGECFDNEDNMSKQIDIIIYDKLFSYAIPYYDDFIQFPCESVYGSIEVKSMLNESEFKKAIENIISLKKLKREDSTSWTVTPNSKISIKNGPNDKSNYYFGIIFAYESVGYETVLKYIKEMNGEPKYLPNAIVLYSQKVIILPMDRTQIHVTHMIDDFIGYEAIHCGEDTLALFIMLIINYLRATKLIAPFYGETVNNILTQYLDKQYVEESNKARIKHCAILKNKLSK